MAESYLPMEIQHHQLLFSVKDAIFDSGHLSFFCLLHFFFSLLACFNFISIFIFSLHLHRHLDSHPHFDLYPSPFFPQTVWYTLRGSYGESKETGARSRCPALSWFVPGPLLLLLLDLFDLEVRLICAGSQKAVAGTSYRWPSTGMVRVDVPETGGETRILGSKLRRRARFRTDVPQIPLKSLGLWWACGPSSWCFACCAKAHERPPGNMTAIDPVYHRLRPTCASSPPWATIYSHQSP